jgi:thymidylate synthase
MKEYLNLAKKVLNNGKLREDRTGTGVYSLFGDQIRFDLSKGFPLLTTKKLNLNAIIHELLWFLNGDTNITYLKKNNVKIWNEWADENNDLGPIYGAQWRNFNNQQKDQISDVISSIKNNPYSRRHIVSAWNPLALPDEKKSFSENIKNGNSALPPCHILFQFYVSEGKLSCQLYQRSADVFLGVPFNIASYSLLTMMLAQICNLEVGEFIHTFGDLHIYKNHKLQMEMQVKRIPKKLPMMHLNKNIKNIFDFTVDDFILKNYDPFDHIKGDISV